MIINKTIHYTAEIEKTDTIDDLKKFYPNWVSGEQYKNIMQDLTTWRKDEDVVKIWTGLIYDKSKFAFFLRYSNKTETKCPIIYKSEK